ncbi:MAG TPA: glucose 1-dehydrogenase [Anaerolineae bacterium]|nr:glucose 1-dehydrogenase [Anaerolineae bacterium]
MRLSNKVAIITGGSSGIGRACCILFAKEGARIVAADIDEAGGQETINTVKQNGGEAIFVRTDVAKAADAERLANETMRAFGAVHILVQNAGIIRPGTVVDTPEDVWDAVLDVNLKGLYLCAKYVIPHMIASGGGSIINTSSAAGLVGAQNQCAYDAAKGGAVNLSRQMALDFAKDNIRVNCLVPGGIDTPQSRNFIKLRPNVRLLEDAHKNWGALKRFGTAEEVANVALFLASDEASFVTGAPFIVDGGYLAE